MASKSCSFIRIHRTPAHTPMKNTGIRDNGCAIENQYAPTKSKIDNMAWNNTVPKIA